METPHADAGGAERGRRPASIEVEVRLFNTLARYARRARRGGSRVSLSSGATVGDALARIGVPPHEVFLALVNGRDLPPGGSAWLCHRLAAGDVLALSGPVPRTWK